MCFISTITCQYASNMHDVKQVDNSENWSPSYRLFLISHLMNWSDEETENMLINC